MGGLFGGVGGLPRGGDLEPAAALEARVAGLLPALMLARVDGKSPVEYLGEAERQRVREMSIPLIAEPEPSLAATVAVLRQRLDT